MLRKYLLYNFWYNRHTFCKCRGLAAATEWGKVWPDSKSNILVTCSVYQASQKVCSNVLNVLSSLFLQIWGPAVRALPVKRSPVSIISSDDGECDEVRGLCYPSWDNFHFYLRWNLWRACGRWTALWQRSQDCSMISSLYWRRTSPFTCMYGFENRSYRHKILSIIRNSIQFILKLSPFLCK